MSVIITLQSDQNDCWCEQGVSHHIWYYEYNDMHNKCSYLKISIQKDHDIH